MLGTATRSEPSCRKLSSVTNRINPNYHMPIVFIPLVIYYPSKVIPTYVLGHIKLGWYEDNWCPKSGKFYAKQKYWTHNLLISNGWSTSWHKHIQPKPWKVDSNINLYFYSTLFTVLWWFFRTRPEVHSLTLSHSVSVK